MKMLSASTITVMLLVAGQSIGTPAYAVQLTIKQVGGLAAHPVSAVLSENLLPPEGVAESPPRPMVLGTVSVLPAAELDNIPIPTSRPDRQSSCPIVWPGSR